MAYLHVLREASRLFDDGATFSHAGAVGTARGLAVAVRLRERGPGLPGAEREPWSTVVEVALAEPRLAGLTLAEREGAEAAHVRARWHEGELEPEHFEPCQRLEDERFEPCQRLEDERFEPCQRLEHQHLDVRFALEGLGAWAAGPSFAPSPALAARLLHHPALVARTIARGERGVVLEVEAPGLAEGEDMERQLELALALAEELSARGPSRLGEAG
jgi:hypothetical protein